MQELALRLRDDLQRGSSEQQRWEKEEVCGHLRSLEGQLQGQQWQVDEKAREGGQSPSEEGGLSPQGSQH